MPRIRLAHLDGQTFAVLGKTPGYNSWAHIQDRTAEEFNCDPDDVHSEERDDGDETLKIGDRPVAIMSLDYGMRWS